MAKTLLEQLTHGGKLPTFGQSMTDAKLMEADKILSGVNAGDHGSITSFKEHLGCYRGESIHTTGDDFIYAFAQIKAFEIQDAWEAAERTWSTAIETETFSSFDTPVSYTLQAQTDGFKRPNEPNKPSHIVPKVAEGAPYPHFRFKGEAAKSSSFGKAGGRFDLSFEDIVKDVVGLVPAVPKLINESLLEREEYEAWQGLISFIDITSNHLTAGKSMLGEDVSANSPLTRAALAVALRQAAQRKIGNRKVRVSGYNLIVPTGAGEDAKFLINTLSLNGLERTNGLDTQLLSVNGYNPLGKIRDVVETDYLTGQRWALVPAKGSISGVDKFYKMGQLVGNIGPEIRLQNVTGQYLGGGTVSPFQGSFDTDSAAFRGRIIGGGVSWNPQFAVISDGTGTP